MRDHDVALGDEAVERGGVVDVEGDASPRGCPLSRALRAVDERAATETVCWELSRM
jgi:hypothetical protein